MANSPSQESLREPERVESQNAHTSPAEMRSHPQWDVIGSREVNLDFTPTWKPAKVNGLKRVRDIGNMPSVQVAIENY